MGTLYVGTLYVGTLYAGTLYAGTLNVGTLQLRGTMMTTGGMIKYFYNQIMENNPPINTFLNTRKALLGKSRPTGYAVH